MAKKKFRIRALNGREIGVINKYLIERGVDVFPGMGHAALTKKIYAFMYPNGPHLGDEPVPFRKQFLRAFYETLPAELRVVSAPPKIVMPKIKRASIKKDKKCLTYAERRAARVAFYESDEWRAVRYEALKASRGVCELCGAAPSPGRPLHVDHIKPRSKYPALELVLSNLQVLCADCNLGKSNTDEIDWRRTA